VQYSKDNIQSNSFKLSWRVLPTFFTLQGDTCVHGCVCVREGVCVCVCDRERERENACA
jgi:hypothetical protein